MHASHDRFRALFPRTLISMHASNRRAGLAGVYNHINVLFVFLTLLIPRFVGPTCCVCSGKRMECLECYSVLIQPAGLHSCTVIHTLPC